MYESTNFLFFIISSTKSDVNVVISYMGFVLNISSHNFLLANKYPALKPASPKDLEKVLKIIKFLYLLIYFINEVL